MTHVIDRFDFTTVEQSTDTFPTSEYHCICDDDDEFFWKIYMNVPDDAVILHIEFPKVSKRLREDTYSLPTKRACQSVEPAMTSDCLDGPAWEKIEFSFDQLNAIHDYAIEINSLPLSEHYANQHLLPDFPWNIVQEETPNLQIIEDLTTQVVVDNSVDCLFEDLFDDDNPKTYVIRVLFMNAFSVRRFDEAIKASGIEHDVFYCSSEELPLINNTMEDVD